MMRYGKCSPSCAVVGLIYLQRVKKMVPSACITSHNMQRLLLIAVMLANKFLDDLYFSNKHWAKIGGLSLKEVNRLELTILSLVGWRMHVTRADYFEYLEELGCAPRANEPECWAQELEHLRELVCSGAGLCLVTHVGADLRSDSSAAPPPPPPALCAAASVLKSEEQRARR